MSTFRLRLVVASVAFVGLVGGCGGGESASDADRVTQVLHNYLGLQASGDATEACGLLTASGQRRLIAYVTAQAAAKGLPAGTVDCPRSVELVRLVAGAKTLAELKDARIEGVRVSGSAATAQVVDGEFARRETVQLEKVGASWRINAVPGLGP